MGAEDRFLVQVYREQVKQARMLLAESLWHVDGRQYHYVGDPTGNQPIKLSLAGWRFELLVPPDSRR